MPIKYFLQKIRMLSFTTRTDLPELTRALLAVAVCQLLAVAQEATSAGLDGTIVSRQLELFFEATNDIALESVNRRKWDNAIIADLDQDGFQDLLLKDHGYSIKLYWNDNGKYAKGTDIMVGDTHGITIGDYDADGNLDILIARGGGSGFNARNAKVLHVSKDRKLTDAGKFKEAFKKIRGRTSKFVDSDNDGDQDLISTAIPLDFADPNGANYIYENVGEGEFFFHGYLPRTFKEGHRILVTDYNNDHISDLVFYGSNRVTMLEGQGDFIYKDVSRTLFKFDHKVEDITSIAEIDYDNDGDPDLYVTRAKNLPHGATFYNAESRALAFFAFRKPLRLDDMQLGEVLEIENYRAAWPDLPVWVGESAYQYKFPGGTHGGQNFRLVSSDALGWPDMQAKQGLHIGYIGNSKWRIETRSTPKMTGVIKRVPFYPELKLEAGPQDMLLENTGTAYADATAKSGLNRNEHSMSVAVGDYDNSGYQDLLVIRRGNPSKPNEQVLYLNDGDGHFKERTKHGVISTELGSIGYGAEAFDYNKDGNVDLIVTNECGKWHLFENVAA